jgi:hypothetical protein
MTSEDTAAAAVNVIPDHYALVMARSGEPSVINPHREVHRLCGRVPLEKLQLVYGMQGLTAMIKLVHRCGLRGKRAASQCDTPKASGKGWSTKEPANLPFLPRERLAGRKHASSP